MPIRRFRDISIQTKLMLIIMLTSTIVLLLVSGSFVAYEMYSFRRNTVRDLSILAGVISTNSNASLAFHDARSGAETLSALSTHTHIISAYIVDRDGSVFARYERKGAMAKVPPIREPGAFFLDNTLALYVPIAMEGQRFGTLILLSDLTEQDARFRGYARIVGFVMIGALLVAFVVSSFLQKVISRPIRHLVDVQSRVSNEKDYGIQAIKEGNDELGLLIDNFNTMLAQIHERDQALAESEGRLRSLFENIPIGVYRTTPDGRVLSVNPALVKMLGYDSAEELMRHNLEDSENLGPAYPRSEFKDRLEQDGEIRSLQAPWRTKDGSIIEINEHAKVVRDPNGKPLYYEGSVEDISDRKRIEQAKSELISLVSHELRVPLTSIVGSLEWMATTMADQLPPPAKKMVEIAYKSSERMVRLINELLDMDRIESGKIQFQMQTLELSSLVQMAIEATQPFAQQFGVQIVMQQSLPVKVNVDSDRMMQVMTNILSNATKFSPLQGTVEVEVSRNNGSARVSVSDHGRGIAPEFQGRIFQKFAQAGGLESRQKGGAGLGLSISKAIMEKMGGQIGFTSNLNVGTTFYCELPETSV